MSFEPVHEKNNKKTCVPSGDSDQHGHLPSLIRVFAVRSMQWVAKNPRFLHEDSKDYDNTGRSLRWAHK